MTDDCRELGWSSCVRVTSAALYRPTTPSTTALQQSSPSSPRMSTTYSLGGATGALAIVGACTFLLNPSLEFVVKIQLTGSQTCSSLAAARPLMYVDLIHRHFLIRQWTRSSDPGEHLGRRLPRIRFPNRLGKLGHLTMHRSVGSRSSMVRQSLGSLTWFNKLTHTSSQGHFYYWILDRRWRCPRPSHPNQEPHLHYLLRGRRNLRRHHVHRLLGQAERHSG